MTTTKKNENTRSNIVLLIFSIVYSFITLSLFMRMQKDPSSTLVYVFMFPIFWIIAGLILVILFWLTKIKIRTIADIIATAFSTPIPFIIFILFRSLLHDSESPTMTSEYNKDGHRYREVSYDYSIGKSKRIEYYKSQDEVNDENPFPVNDIWIKDSIWTYYTKEGQVEKTEDYRNK